MKRRNFIAAAVAGISSLFISSKKTEAKSKINHSGPDWIENYEGFCAKAVETFEANYYLPAGWKFVWRAKSMTRRSTKTNRPLFAEDWCIVNPTMDLGVLYVADFRPIQERLLKPTTFMFESTSYTWKPIMLGYDVFAQKIEYRIELIENA